MNEPDHTIDSIRALVAVPEERLALYLADVGSLALVDIIRHMLDVVGRQRAMLEIVEWSARRPPMGAESCPCCDGCNPRGGWDSPSVRFGHTPDCALAALLRETA